MKRPGLRLTSLFVLLLFVLIPVASAADYASAASQKSSQVGTPTSLPEQARANAFTPPSDPTILVQQNSQGFNEFSTEPLQVAFGSDVGSGDTIVVAVVIFGGSVKSIADTLGSTYQLLGSVCDSPVCTYVYNTTIGTGGADTFSVTASGTPEQSAVYIYDVSGVTTSMTVGVATGTTGASSTATTQTAQTSSAVAYQAGAFLLGVIGTIELVNSPVAGTGYSLTSTSTGDTQEDGIAEWSTPGAGGSTDFPLTYSSADAITWAEVGIALEPSSSTITSTSTTTSSTSFSTSTSTTNSAPPGETQVSVTLNQFEDYGSILSASNYFVVSYIEGGSEHVADETGGLLTISADSSTTVTISAASSGSSIFEQWCLAMTMGACQETQISVGASAVSVGYVYFDLQAQTVAYQVSGGTSALDEGSPVAPSFGPYATAPSTATSSRVALTATLSTVPEAPSTPAEVWVVAGTVEDFQSVINSDPATPYEQWLGVPNCTYALGGGLNCGSFISDAQVGPFTTGGAVLLFTYYNQYEIQVEYSVTSGSGYTAPMLGYTSGGAAAQIQLTTTLASVWMDVGSTWSLNGLLSGSGSTEQWVCTAECSGIITAGIIAPGTYDEQIDAAYAHQYLVTFGVIDLWDCTNAATNTVYLCSQSGLNADGSISPSGPSWEDAGAPFAVTQTPAVDVNQGFGLSCGYAPTIPMTPCYWTTSDPTGITFGSSCTHTTGNSCETEFTANAAGTISAYFGIPTSSGTTPNCGAAGTYVDGGCECPAGSVSTGGGCACDGSGCDGLGDYGMIFDPAYVLVTAPNGLTQVGCDAGGNVIDTIPGATIGSCAGGTGTILIADPVTGIYEIQIFSVGASSAYNITLISNAISGGQLDKTGLEGSVSSGAPEVEYLTLASDGSLVISSNVSSSSSSFSTTTVGVPELPPIAGVGFLLLLVLLLPVLLLIRRDGPKR